jgi:hypothetical protein
VGSTSHLHSHITTIDSCNWRVQLNLYISCICYAQIPKEKRYKLDETSEKCIFVGYNSISKGYRLYNLKTNKVIISRDVLFDEKAKWNWEQGQVEEQLVPVIVLQQSLAQGSVSNDDSTHPSSSLTPSPSLPSSPSSSSTSPSSSLIRLRNLDDTYAMCNFVLLNLKTLKNQ